MNTDVLPPSARVQVYDPVKKDWVAVTIEELLRSPAYDWRTGKPMK